jgi:hypothetical protein
MEKYFFIVSSTDVFSVFDVFFLEVELCSRVYIFKKRCKITKKKKEKDALLKDLTQKMFFL